jgi:hypothetical protein
VLKHAGIDIDKVDCKHVQFDGFDKDPAGAPYGASIPIEMGFILIISFLRLPAHCNTTAVVCFLNFFFRSSKFSVVDLRAPSIETASLYDFVSKSGTGM